MHSRQFAILSIVATSIFLPVTVFAGKGGGGSKGSSAGGVVHVNGYTRKDGTYVAPHDRTAPNGTTSDNWSARGVSPESTSAGTIRPEVGTSSIPAAPAATAPVTRTQARVRVVPRVNPSTHELVFVNSGAKLYYRADCAHENATTTMVKSKALAAGFRPAPSCYAPTPTTRSPGSP